MTELPAGITWMNGETEAKLAVDVNATNDALEVSIVSFVKPDLAFIDEFLSRQLVKSCE